MPVLGYLIKNLLHWHKRLSPNRFPSEKLQEKQLQWLLSKAEKSAFGKRYGFSEILNAEDVVGAYQRRVPIFEYDQMNEEWWLRQQTEENITWPGKPDYFAISSGTTGSESKRVPVTSEMLECIQKVGKKQIASLVNYNLEAPLFEKQILMLGSATALKPNKGFLEGEITGISASNLPKWFKPFHKPGEAITAIADWDIKSQLIAEQAKDWDIVAITGIPFWIILMLKKIIAYNNVNTIHDIWPNLTIYGTGGVAFEPYREEINKLTSQPLQIMDTYLASEGFLAYTARPDTMSMKLAIDCGMFFEFIPVDKEGFNEDGNLLENPKVLTIEQVTENKEYALLISTPAGAWRYMIGDTIKFTSLDQCEIILSGRTKYWLNVIGAQLTEEKMNEAILQLSAEMNVPIKEYSVAAMVDQTGCYYHQWIFGTEESLDEEFAAQRLDEILQFLNKNYASSRSKVLKYITVQTLPSTTLYNWLGAGSKKGGQLKFPKVMTEEKMNDLLTFTNTLDPVSIKKRA